MRVFSLLRRFSSTDHRVNNVNNPIIARLEAALRKRRETGKLRQLTCPIDVGIDFSSNDYLGLSRNVNLQQRIEDDWHNYRKSWEGDKNAPPLLGSTGSRLLTGNSLETLGFRFENRAYVAIYNKPANSIQIYNCFSPETEVATKDSQNATMPG